MTSFETSAELAIHIPDRELRSARQQVEESIGSVAVDVDGGRPVAPDGGTSSMALASGGAANELSEQTSVLEEIHDELEKIGVSGGGGGGGGGLLGGSSGVAVGSLLGGGGGLTAGASLLGGVSLTGAAGLGSLAVGGGAFLADQYVGEDAAGIEENVGRGMPSMVEHTVGSRIDWRPPEWEGLSGMMSGIDVSPPTDLWSGVADALDPPEDMWPDLQGDSGEQPGSEETPLAQQKEAAYSDGVTGAGELGPSGNPGRGEGEFRDTTNYAAGYQSGHQRLTFASTGATPSSAAPGMDSGTQRVGGDNGNRSSNRARDRSGQRTEVNVQEVNANIDGRSLKDALDRSIRELKPELRDEILAEIETGMSPR